MWLDAAYPVGQPQARAGVLRGPCQQGVSNTPEFLEAHNAAASVRYSNIKIGEIGSTGLQLPRVQPAPRFDLPIELLAMAALGVIFALACTGRRHTGIAPAGSCDLLRSMPLDDCWEVQLEHGWTQYDAKTSRLITIAAKAGHGRVTVNIQRQKYQIDICRMLQINVRTGFCRSIRRGGQNP
mmetsp:Transcript_106719/g.297027  ORF Transcript_106719/g.297027 Transcript_106719/m.297027 type:complete len:182 (+) Transcript_106719:2-547(+)